MARKRPAFTAAQKTEAVRKPLKDHPPVSQIAEPTDVQSPMLDNWGNAALPQVEHPFRSTRDGKAEGHDPDDTNPNTIINP